MMHAHDRDHDRDAGSGQLLHRSPELAARRAAWREPRPGSTTIYGWSVAATAPPLQVRAFDAAIGGLHDAVQRGNHEVWGDPLPPHLAPGAPVQRREASPAVAVADPHAVARRGLAGAGGALPHRAQIQRAFGHHDVSGVRAHTDGAAEQAASALQAHAFASGSDVVLGPGGRDLHTVAHEAAHVVQQRGGVSLKGGVGQAGDAHERHADAVADAVVRGDSAEALLDQYAPGGGAPVGGVQRRAVQLRAFVGQNNAESVSVIQEIIAGTDVGALEALAAAMERAADARRESGGVDHVTGSGGGHTFDLTISQADADGLRPRLDHRIGELSQSNAGRGGQSEGPATEAPASREDSDARVDPDSSRTQAPREQSGAEGSGEPRQLGAFDCQGWGAFAQAVGGAIEGVVANPGSSVRGSLSAAVDIEGVVLSISISLSASRGEDGNVTVTGSESFGVGAGTARNNASLTPTAELRVSGVNGAQAIGMGIASALRQGFVSLGEGPAPPPWLASIENVLTGGLGSMVDGVWRWAEGVRTGNYRNPSFGWLADCIWGEGFGQAACEAMGDGAAVETRQGGAVEGRAEGGEEGSRASASGSIGARQVTRTECGPEGAQTQSTWVEGAFSATAGTMGWTGRLSITLPLQRDTGVSPSASVSLSFAGELSGAQAALFASLRAALARILTALDTADRNAPSGAVRQATHHASPLLEGAIGTLFARIPGSRGGLSVTLSLRQGSSTLTATATQSIGTPSSLSTDAGRLSGSFEAGQQIGPAIPLS